mmetsp:Transcript_19081/g.31254  ORF Transcript_19081/g.31254 Transcript_19081/m.31254 type:complete len:205 (+) Transcript_19081:464-1078(+)|eukprot:CAMPEP_0203753408 /NCGR_PEP_ID=MMETSP0098-20131031/7185_1 /ASSEMBLY_ACC=CAM_ASM_000208 /TAXON_ID=96639 /ORGANISM=" , Strain NY0313808BC1" /LENGTH=204 /DNA_ID=CAMNT_0050643999 /DNA_START=378 /DNA_END=992 /DNA_ORIENTATION=-
MSTLVRIVAFKPLFLVGELAATLIGCVLCAPLLLCDPKCVLDNADFATKCLKVPFFGSYVFKMATMNVTPFTNSIGPHMEKFERNEQRELECVAYMMERTWLHNPFKCIHAAALMNLGEYTGGVAMITLMKVSDPPFRGIVTDLSANYVKKARGRITGYATIPDLKVIKTFTYDSVCKLVDESGDTVATVTATWTLSPKKSKHA